MKLAIGITLIVVGAVLLFYGFRADGSFSSEVSKIFSGHPTDRTLWFLIGGAASVVAGLVLALGSRWRSM